MRSRFRRTSRRAMIWRACSPTACGDRKRSDRASRARFNSASSRQSANGSSSAVRLGTAAEHQQSRLKCFGQGDGHLGGDPPCAAGDHHEVAASEPRRPAPRGFRLSCRSQLDDDATARAQPDLRGAARQQLVHDPGRGLPRRLEGGIQIDGLAMDPRPLLAGRLGETGQRRRGRVDLPCQSVQPEPAIQPGDGQE